MNFKDIIAKHALAQGIDWRGPEDLEKAYIEPHNIRAASNLGPYKDGDHVGSMQIGPHIVHIHKEMDDGDESYYSVHENPADPNSKILGSLTVSHNPGYTAKGYDEDWDGTPHTEHSAVLEEHRGKGIGSALYEAALKHNKRLNSSGALSPMSHARWQGLKKVPGAKVRLARESYAGTDTPHKATYDESRIKPQKAAKSDHLEKDAGQIKMPHLADSKFTRPDQQVKRVGGGDEYQKLKSANTEQGVDLGLVPPANQRVQPFGGELVFDQRRGSTKAPYAIVGRKASRGIEHHEGFHALSQHLVNKHGVDKIHNLYNNLLEQEVHPKVHEALHNILQGSDNYRKMSKIPDKKWQVRYAEEKINLLHDLVHEGKDAKGLRRRAASMATPEDLSKFGFKNHRDFDNELKSSWKRLRDKANAVKPEDL